MKNSILIVFFVFVSCHRTKDRDVLVQSIMETDRAFSALSAEKGMAYAFITFCDAQGVLLRSNNYPLEGRETISAYFSARNDSAYQLSWEPLFADVSISGDLGYSYGIYNIMENTNRQMVVTRGTYLSIWKRQDDGSWKYVLDTGNSGLGEE